MSKMINFWAKKTTVVKLTQKTQYIGKYSNTNTTGSGLGVTFTTIEKKCLPR